MTDEKHILSVQTQNTPGVLSRIAGLLRRKLFNIDSLTVGRTHNPEISQFTIVILGSKIKALKAASVIERLIEIQKVEVFEPLEVFKREIVLARIEFKNTKEKNIFKNLKPEDMLIQEINTSKNISVFELVDKSSNLETFLKNLEEKNIKVQDWVRSGIIALEK